MLQTPPSSLTFSQLLLFHSEMPSCIYCDETDMLRVSAQSFYTEGVGCLFFYYDVNTDWRGAVL